MYSHFLTKALQISILALKNRPNPRTRQRILLFIGSKIAETVDAMGIIGRKLSKNNVALTIFAFGESSPEQKNKIDALFRSVNNEDNSQLYWLERGRNLADALVSSALFRDSNDKPLNPTEVDADMDPELAMAIKMSLEENQRREAEEAAKAAAASADKPLDEKNVMKAPADKMEVEKQPDPNINDLDDDQAEELAKQLSLQEAERERERDTNLKGKDKMDDDGKDDDDKKKKEQDKETLASEKFEQSEIPKGDIGISDFLTEKHNPRDTHTQKFMRDLDKLVDDDDDEEEEGDGKSEKKGGKKDKKKQGHMTEKHNRKKEDEEK